MGQTFTLETLIEICSQKPGAEKTLPFGPETLVMKVGGKMFALIPLDSSSLSINLKCDPFLAQGLRERYPAIKPGYHMNKVHWNTVHIDGSIPEDIIKNLIDHSYDLVYNSLTKKKQEEVS